MTEKIKIRKKHKKGQEEIVGFVLIIVLVAVIAVIFLGFSLRNQKALVERNSTKVQNLLESLKLETSSCIINEPKHLNIKELIISCSESGICLNNKTACESLTDEVKDLLEKAKASEQSIRNYSFSAYTGNKIIVNVTEGKLSGSIYGASLDIPSSIKIRVKLEIS